MNLAGTVSRQVPPLLAMTRSMTQRGPDDEGYLLVDPAGGLHPLRGDDSRAPPSDASATFPRVSVREFIDTPTRVALGHRRLSILDLSAHGHQPMTTRDGRYTIVFNGEIYNYLEIGAALRNHGFTPRGHSDTEVLLEAYAQWGKDCVVRLNGDFAFAVWDSVEQCLFCCRDRIGIKPFYYTIRDGQFLFASDITSLIASGLFPPRPDPEGLYLSMAFGIAPRPTTAFEGVRSLQQGHWMKVHRNGEIERECYWRIPVGTTDRAMRETDARAALEEKLTAAVRRRLVADVDVATFMSGGIDSTTISAIAAQAQPGIKAFTLAYEDSVPELDELPQAQATARMHPMEHIVHRVDPLDLIRDIEAHVEGYEEPYYSLAPNHVIAKVVRQNGVKVALNGLGGDELFGGYGYYRHVSRWRAVRALRPIVRAVAPIFGRRGGYLSRLADATTATQYHTALFMHYNEAELAELFGQPIGGGSILERVDTMYATGRRFDDAFDAISYMDMMNYLGNHHVHRIDKFTMAFSVEGRFPYLDHEVVELAFRMPASLKIRGSEQKYILRRVASRHIAPQCLQMKKKGFSLPLHDWMRGPLKLLVREALGALKERGVLVPQTIDRFVSEYENGRRGPTHIWHLVALELWFRRFID